MEISRPTVDKIIVYARELRISEADKLAVGLGIMFQKFLAELRKLKWS